MSTIPTGLAKQLINNYADYKIGTEISDEETRGVWFSKDDILAALKDVRGVSPNGLRFYFGAYEIYKPGRVPRFPDDEEKITLVIIPTTGKDSNGNTVSHPYRTGEFLSFDLLEDPLAKPGYPKEIDKELNDGQICPPPPVLT